MWFGFWVAEFDLAAASWRDPVRLAAVAWGRPSLVTLSISPAWPATSVVRNSPRKVAVRSR
jgi:hypothetical protein